MGIGESSPAVSNGLVYVGDLAGVLHAVDAGTGEAAWTYQTDGEIKSSPVVTGDIVLIGSYDAHLYGLDAGTGELIWKFETLNYVHATPAVVDGVAYFGGCDEVFRGVRVSDGEEVFSVPAGAYTAASATTSGKPGLLRHVQQRGDRCRPRLQGAALALRASAAPLPLLFLRHECRRNHRHRRPRPHGARDRPGDRGGALDVQNPRARIDSSPAAAGDRVFIGSGDGRLYMLDLESGENLWDFDTGAPLSASPAIADGKIVIGSQDGVLYCFG